MGAAKKVVKGFSNTIKGIAHGDLKSILSVAASVAVPFLAPELSAAIGLSGAIGSTAGSALTGALMGGVSNKVLGGNFASGALMGAVSGGIAGYNAAPATATEVGGAAGGVEVTPSTAGLEAASGSYMTPSGMLDLDAAYNAGMSYATDAIDSGTFGGLGASTGAAGFSALNAPTNSLVFPGGVDPMTSAPNYVKNTFGTGAIGNAAATVNDWTGGALNTGLGAVDKATTAAGGWWNGLSEPTKSAAIQGGMQYLAGSLSGGGAYDTSMIDKQMQYLNQMSDLQKNSYNKKMAAAEGIIGSANYYDPHYFGSQARNQALISGTAAKNAALREAGGQGRGYASDAEARRYNLGTSLNAATQYTQAADAAQNQRLRTIETGARLIPDAPNDISGSYLSGYPIKANANLNYLKTFEDIYGTLYSKSNDKDKDKDAKKTTMV